MVLKVFSATLAVLASAIALPSYAQTPYATVSSETFAKAPGSATLIDVREPTEWAKTGVPAGAQKISISRADFVDAVLQAVGGDKSKPVALICRSGSRSVRAAEQLAAAGFSRVTNVGDGMIGHEGVGQGWLEAGLPLTRIDTGE